MGLVFISYRRGLTDFVADLICHDLATEFGRERIFLDVDDIGPGAAAISDIDAAIERSDVVIAVIGPDWSPDRLHADDDVVRRELEAALELALPVLPVLTPVGNQEAQLPRQAELPSSLRTVFGRNAIRLDRADKQRGLGHLRGEVDRHLRSAGDPTTPGPHHASITAERWLTEANRLSRLGVLDGAADAFERARAADPMNARALLAQFEFLEQIGSRRKAVDALERLLVLTPGDANLHNRRGNLLRHLEQYADALDAYDRATALDPTSKHHNNRGSVLHRLGRFDEAIAACDEAIERDPSNANAHKNRGLALEGAGRYWEALSAYETALQLAPGYDEVTTYHAALLSLLEGDGSS